MKYNNITKATFINRPNRFIAEVDIDGRKEIPNKVANEWLQTQGYSKIVPEYTYGESRIDFYMEKKTEEGKVWRFLMEVKGCTLEIDGIGYFPDALDEARAAGVEIMYLPCHVEPAELVVVVGKCDDSCH